MSSIAYRDILKRLMKPGGYLVLAGILTGEYCEVRKKFDSTVVGKTESQMKAYWARLIFTGKAVPLKELANDQEIITLVEKNPSTIGYIDNANVTNKVKVLFTF